MKSRTLLKLSSFIILLLLSVAQVAEAKTAIKTRHNDQNNNTYTLEPARLPKGAVVGSAWYLPKKGKGGYNSSLLLAPASTMKVLTAAAAMTVLGSSYRFETEIKTSPQAYNKATQTRVLNADLVIKFSGDPTLTSLRLKKLLQTVLTDKNIHRINGNIILDASDFVGYDRGLGWTWDDLPLCFSAPAGAIVIDHNCIYTSAVLKKGQQEFTIEEQQGYVPVHIAMNTPLIPQKDYKAEACSLRVEPSLENVYNISGCFSNTINSSKNYKLNFKFAVQNPDRWGIDIVKLILNELGVKVKGSVYVSRLAIPDVKRIAFSRSPTLDKLLDHTLKKSDNLYAEEIARATARAYYRYPVSIRQSAQGVQAILKRYGNIDFMGTSLYDGSGLSSYNIITPRIVLNVLIYILNNEAKLHLIDLLPQSGVSGTLRSRRSVVNYPLKTQVYAKTGTIRNVRNLAGFVKSSKGNLIPFVVYTTGFSLDKAEVQYMNKNHTLWPNYEYEKRFLQYLYEEKTPKINKNKL